MGAKLDLKGKVFGRLVVISENIERSKNSHISWLCKCECGEEVSILGLNLRRGFTKSCGCLRAEILKKRSTTHGLRGHPLYSIWHNMKARCNDTKKHNYRIYGGRGITVCDYWLDDFMNFYGDMEEGYKEGLQIDRKDGDKGYYKENCRWTTPQQNTMNTRSHRDSTSRYKGVSWRKKSNKWVANISKDGKLNYLGAFICEKEAALAYNERAKELQGKYAYLNKVD